MMRRLLILGVLLAVVSPLSAQKHTFFQSVSWSPDGQWLTFTTVATEAPWTSNIMRMRPNGKDARPIPHGLASARWTAWHPEGRLLAFAGELDNNWDIYVIDLESEAVTQLTHTRAHESAPSWSPDGSQLVFAARVDGQSQIYRMRADGSGRTNLSQNDRNDWNPAWSPAGDQIVFYAARDTTADHLYLMGVDGSDQRQLTRGPQLRDTFPGWSADGERVVFGRQQTGASSVYQVARAGSVPEELVTGAFFARVSPDGTQVAFIRGDWPKSAIYVGRIDQPEYKDKRIRH